MTIEKEDEKNYILNIKYIAKDYDEQIELNFQNIPFIDPDDGLFYSFSPVTIKQHIFSQPNILGLSEDL